MKKDKSILIRLDSDEYFFISELARCGNIPMSQLLRESVLHNNINIITVRNLNAFRLILSTLRFLIGRDEYLLDSLNHVAFLMADKRANDDDKFFRDVYSIMCELETELENHVKYESQILGQLVDVDFPSGLFEKKTFEIDLKNKSFVQKYDGLLNLCKCAHEGYEEMESILNDFNIPRFKNMRKEIDFDKAEFQLKINDSIKTVNKLGSEINEKCISASQLEERLFNECVNNSSNNKRDLIAKLRDININYRTYLYILWIALSQLNTIKKDMLENKNDVESYITRYAYENYLIEKMHSSICHTDGNLAEVIKELHTNDEYNTYSSEDTKEESINEVAKEGKD